MTHEQGLEIKIHAGLLALDGEARERVRREGCGRCGGRLHVANYRNQIVDGPRTYPRLPL